MQGSWLVEESRESGCRERLRMQVMWCSKNQIGRSQRWGFRMALLHLPRYIFTVARSQMESPQRTAVAAFLFLVTTAICTTGCSKADAPIEALPRNFLGFSLAETLSEVDAWAKEAKMWDYNSSIGHPSKHQRIYTLSGNSKFSLISINLFRGKVASIEASYKYNANEWQPCGRVMNDARRRFGKPLAEGKNPRHREGLWHSRAVWLDKTTRMLIFCNKEGWRRNFAADFILENLADVDYLHPSRPAMQESDIFGQNVPKP